MKRFLLALLKLGLIANLANEVRGAILAGPVLYGLWLSGGTWMAAWLAFCSLAGIAASVVIPVWAAKKLKHKLT